jgi:hypothetical protein
LREFLAALRNPALRAQHGGATTVCPAQRPPFGDDNFGDAMMNEVRALACAVVLLAPAAAFAGAATNDARNVYESENVGSSTQTTDQQLAVRDRLSAEGYEDVSDIRPELGGYTATVVKDSKVMKVLIDPASGEVHRLR